ncbi:hypothetical protein RHM65_22185 [Pseudomonas sp. CCI4.2]|uniref:hypothetical protein n=1 Tax=Pseudomonas sp. CCI4.2 TaxID=3048620 RepID=UPI002AC8ADC1|nr:hypothetical protein [Pseudomonas sp. CCI4.2]MEB0090085.1 hypothetical protein [Pseudomonas sp. CCI4.2]WPX56515.1 hypothetical protein RHM65_22185 [Pseudomonas sp. CCI4.2]
MLNVSINTGGDYLEYLRPYILDVLVNDPPELITDASVAEKLLARCGLKIPSRTVQIILQRLAKERLLVKESGVFVVSSELPPSDLSAARANASRHITLIVNELIGFAHSNSNRILSEESATESLVYFLSQFSIPCLKSYLRGTTLPEIRSGADWQISLVGHFVTALQAQPNLLDSFMMLMHGHMLANALLCPDLDSVTDSYAGVVFYFDTPLLIRLLGLDGEREEQAIKEIVALVQRLEGQVRYFSHTYDELTTAIKISADFIDSYKGRGTIVGEAKKSGKQKSDLIMIASRAAELLELQDIKVVSTPSYGKENHKFEISEEAFSAVLCEEIEYNNPRAKDYDIRSVRSIYVLRRDTSPVSVEKAKAVLVTSNSSLSKAAYEYGKSFQTSREVSTVITDFSLANTAWLKAPQGAPALPKKEILAFAYAAARPTKDFWDKVLIEAEKLESSGKITPREHQLIRSSYSVQTELTRLTLGVEAALTDEGITATLARISDEIRKEELVQKNIVNEKLEQANSKLEMLTGNLDLVRQTIYWSSKSRASLEGSILSLSIWTGQALVAIFGCLNLKDDTSLGWLIICLAAISGGLRVAGTHWDIKPVNIKPRYINWRLSKLYERRLTNVGLPFDVAHEETIRK